MTTSEIWRPPTEFAEQCRDLYSLTCPPLWGTPRRPEFPTLGGKAAEVMRRLGVEPMPWQRYVLDVALEIDPSTGLFAYRSVGLSVPRQQGKTELVLAVMMHRVAAWKRQHVMYAAQTRGMARTRFEDEFVVKLDSSSLKGRYRTRMTNGNEAIIWNATRSKLGITSNTERAGHGPPLDLGVIDEAFAHEDDRLEQAMSPAMLTRGMAQLWWASAGGTEKSVWLNRKRERGREMIQALWVGGKWPATAYFEWFAPSDLSRDDPATWRSCMPALGHTVTEDIVRVELDKLEPPEFDRAMLNRTRVSGEVPDPHVPVEQWPGRLDVKSRLGRQMTFGLDVSPDREHAAICAYGPRPDGREHMELVTCSCDHGKGADWVPARLATLKAKWKPLAIGLDVVGAPAAALLGDLEKAGITRPEGDPRIGDLAIPTAGEYAAACAQWADSVRQGRAAHLGQAELDAAVVGARSRPLVDAYAWKRSVSTSDITSLVAVTLARWAYQTRAHLVADYDLMASVY